MIDLSFSAYAWFLYTTPRGKVLTKKHMLSQASEAYGQEIQDIDYIGHAELNSRAMSSTGPLFPWYEPSPELADAVVREEGPAFSYDEIRALVDLSDLSSSLRRLSDAASEIPPARLTRMNENLRSYASIPYWRMIGETGYVQENKFCSRERNAEQLTREGVPVIMDRRNLYRVKDFKKLLHEITLFPPKEYALVRR